MGSNSDLEKINDALHALRDHFEKQGKLFIVAYAIEADDGKGVDGNLIASSAESTDYYAFIARTAHIACQHIDEPDEPWKNNN